MEYVEKLNHYPLKSRILLSHEQKPVSIRILGRGLIESRPLKVSSLRRCYSDNNPVLTLPCP